MLHIKLKRKYLLLTILFSGTLIITGCVGQGNQTTQVQLTGETKQFTMTAKQWEFQPPTITVNQGDLVKISIISVDVAHGFALPTFGVSTVLRPGQTTNVEFVASKVGRFTFFCTVSCGLGHSNMRGSLIVK